MIGTFLVLYLYLFSTPMREVTASANYNAREWIRGRWSIRTGRSTVAAPKFPFVQYQTNNTTSAQGTYTTSQNQEFE